MPPIQIADSSAYVGWRGAVEEGCSAETHFADFVFPNDARGRAQRAVVKLYPVSSAGLINELIGYALGKALHLPQPEHAAVFSLPLENLPSRPSWVSAQDTEWIAFCTNWVPKQTLKPWFDKLKGSRTNPPDKKTKNAMRKISAELNQWSRATKTAAFDHWTGNSDRNIGNLIRMGKGSFIVLDHGQLLGGTAWMSSAPDKNSIWENKLEKLIALQWEHKTKGMLATRMYSDSSDFSSTESFDMIEKIISLLNEDLSSQQQDYLKHFLHHRAGVVYLRGHYRVLA